MNIPRFTAEASLFNSRERYHATTDAGFYGGAVQPAQSDMYTPHHPPRVTPDSSVYHPRPVYCLRTECRNVSPAGQPPKLLCELAIGFRNPLTGQCEVLKA
jgi:hypothetical protein